MSGNKSFLKIIIIGDSGVGKTSLLEAYTYNSVSALRKPTIGAEFTKKKLTLNHKDPETGLPGPHDGLEVSMQLWDTAG